MVTNRILSREEFNAKHIVCPKCKTTKDVKATDIYLVRSEARDYADNLNTAWCSCGWRGKRMDLLNPTEEKIEN